MRLHFLILFIVIFGHLNGVYAQNTVEGDWKGSINIQGQQLAVIFHLQEVEGNVTGTIDIPQQGAMALPLKRAEHHQDSVLFSFFTGQGDGVFKGVIENDDLISGTYTQGVASFPFEVRRSEISDQNDAEPGKGEEIIISHEGGMIGGTLVLPETDAQIPLVIMISGSGAQDRDSNVLNFKIFAEMAEQLKHHGIASFRYDDRGVGKSTGDFSEATLNILSEDVEAILKYFSTNTTQRFSEIILLGHSQGGVVAAKTASNVETVDRLILMASTGVNLKEVVRFQVKQAYGSGIHSEEKVDREITLRENLMEAIKEQNKIEEAKQEYLNFYRNEILENLPQAQKSSIGDLDAVAKNQVNQLEMTFSSPQVQSLLFYDPTQDLKSLNIPVLVLFGGKDTQVTEAINSEPIIDALKKAGVVYKVNVFPDANHLFQKAGSGHASEYALLEKDFTEGFIDDISGWINKN